MVVITNFDRTTVSLTQFIENQQKQPMWLWFQGQNLGHIRSHAVKKSKTDIHGFFHILPAKYISKQEIIIRNITVEVLSQYILSIPHLKEIRGKFWPILCQIVVRSSYF